MANSTTLPAPERGNIKATNGETQSAISAVVEHVEGIKTRLKDVIGDLSKTIELLKAAEKEKKATPQGQKTRTGQSTRICRAGERLLADLSPDSLLSNELEEIARVYHRFG